MVKKKRDVLYGQPLRQIKLRHTKWRPVTKKYISRNCSPNERGGGRGGAKSPGPGLNGARAFSATPFISH